MTIQLETRLVPIPGIPKPVLLAPPLGLLQPLVGTWKGTGFNQIFRPFMPSNGSDTFLELNLTTETLQFTEIPGEIANRGLLQPDISLFGLTYLQQVADANVTSTDGTPAGIHIEPGIWVNIPATTNPAEPATVARLANIPHGTSLVAQGTAQVVMGPPVFPKADITPFVIDETTRVPFPALQNLSTQTPFRSPPGNIVGITQQMVDDPNSVLAAALAGKTITSTTVIQISTSFSTVGGGIANIAFLTGKDKDHANARAAGMDATFWISPYTDAHGHGIMLQYSQIVVLDFNGLHWPHISVASLIKQQITKIKDKEFKQEQKELIKEVADSIHPTPAFNPGPAGPAEAAPGAGQPFIAAHERPTVSGVTTKDPGKSD